jgi:hypothetical protein
MTRLITPELTGELKAAYVEKALKAAEAARVLHNALHALTDGPNDERLQTRMDAVGQLEGELLEHAMRVTLG